MPDSNKLSLHPFISLMDGKIFQNLKVSSPAPVTIVDPSGLVARYRTRCVWPLNVATFFMFGYDHTFTSFWEYPWVLTTSWRDLLNYRLHIWEPVSSEHIISPVKMLRILIIRSAVPPPVAKSPCWCGDHAKALTAALWSLKLLIAWPLIFHTKTRLSLPPEAKYWSSLDHFNPQISCLCSDSLWTKLLEDRKSLCRMLLSLDPVDSNLRLQAMDPTRISCPFILRISFCSLTSQIITFPLLHPTAREQPSVSQHTEVIESRLN